MAKLKPYSCTTQSPLSFSDYRLLPFPISKINLNSSLSNPIFLRISQSHSTPIHQPIVCAKRRRGRGRYRPSNRKILQLASTIAFNLRILPEPFNSLVGEIAHDNWKDVRREFPVLSLFFGGLRGDETGKRRKRKLEWFVFALICAAGLGSWRISELDLFVKALLFCLFGISLIRLWWQKKAIKEWFLGFFVGVALILSSRLGKEDAKFWVRKLSTCSPVALIAVRKRNGIFSK